MRYFIVLLFGLLLTFTGCGKKFSSHPEASTPSPIVATGRISAETSGDMPAEASVVAPEPVPSPVMSSDSIDVPSDEPTTISTPPKEVQSGILTAADIDDNLNLNYFQKYVNKALQSTAENTFPLMNTKDRFTLKVIDSYGKGINRAKVSVGNFTSYTNSAGILHLFPAVDNINSTSITINGKALPVNFQKDKEKTITLHQSALLPKTLDLMFVLDTTGSMGDEMRYLEKEFDAIVSNIKEKHPDVEIRFGLTLYRDVGDDYVVRDFDFTSSVNVMKEQLEKQSANGGGDYPEAMDEGIKKALDASWQANDGVRMMFLVADAPPHDENIKQMVPIIEKARAEGIHIYSLGASGVAEKAEYFMRHLALFTQGRYLWLTDDSGVGNSHEEPKVNCYQVTRLDQLIARVIQSELSGKRIEADRASILRTVGSYQNGICK
ncbi:VWA domain-containing protein [bacterium]|nr:VWA domain-containing protein [bacterium]MBU1958335.1 VWA domain-containing protein [bacterium]